MGMFTRARADMSRRSFRRNAKDRRKTCSTSNGGQYKQMKEKEALLRNFCNGNKKLD